MERFKDPINKHNIKAVKALPGISRYTLVFGDEGTMCEFHLETGSELPLHSHPQVQMGYVIKGKLKFFTEQGEFLAESGDSYYFEGNEKHGAQVIKEATVIDIFIPGRPEYLPKEEDYIPSRNKIIQDHS